MNEIPKGQIKKTHTHTHKVFHAPKCLLKTTLCAQETTLCAQEITLCAQETTLCEQEIFYDCGTPSILVQVTSLLTHSTLIPRLLCEAVIEPVFTLTPNP